jgi:uncharacterized membrane protein
VATQPRNAGLKPGTAPGAATWRLAGLLLAAWPADAFAQKVPWIVLPLAASPLVALLLCVALGVVARSWRAGLGHAALVLLWVGWFWAASNHSTSDALTWAPIAVLALHMLALLAAIVRHRRRRR